MPVSNELQSLIFSLVVVGHDVGDCPVPVVKVDMEKLQHLSPREVGTALITSYLMKYRWIMTPSAGTCR